MTSPNKANHTAQRSPSGSVPFFIYLILAIVIMQANSWIIPIIGWLDIPFGYFRTYFHEMSHGLAALLTGGEAGPFVQNLNGGGHILILGGWPVVTLFAGYAGTFIFGALIYLMAADGNHRRSSLLSHFIAGIVALTAIFWVRDLITAGIVLFIILSFGLLGRWDNMITHSLFRFIGMFVVLSGIYAPTWQYFYLLRGDQTSDAGQLALQTGIPAVIWIGLWVLCGFLTLLLMYRWEKRGGL